MINNHLYKKIDFMYLVEVDYKDKFTHRIKQMQIYNSNSVNSNIEHCYLCSTHINVPLSSVFKEKNVANMYIKVLCEKCKKNHFVECKEVDYNSFLSNIIERNAL